MALELEDKIKQLADIARELFRLGVTTEGHAGEQLRQLSRGLKDAAEHISDTLPLTAGAEEYFKLARFAANAPGYFYTLMLSPDGHWSMPFASTGIKDVHGIDPVSVAESISALTSLAHSEDVDLIVGVTEASARDLSPYHVEYRIHHPHKGERWIESRAQPQREQDGSTIWHGFMHDITRRKKVEGMLRFIAQRDDLTDANDFSTSLARQLAATLGMDYVVIDRLAEDPNVAETTALYARGGMLPNMRYPLAGTPCENVMGRKLCSYPRDIQAMFPADTMLVDMGAQSYAGVPLWDSAGRAIGLIAVLDSKPMADIELVESVLQAAAPAAAAALERARSERQLRDREQRFRSLAENLPLAISRLDCKNDYRYIYINPAHEHLLGTTADDVRMRLAGEDHAELQTQIERVVSTGEPQQLRLPVRTQDGDFQIHDISLIPERDARLEIVSILCLGQDVTSQLRLQETMAASEHLFRSLAENLPDNIARWGRSGNYLYVNPSLERTLGVPAAQLIGKRSTDTGNSELYMAIAYAFASGKGSTVRYPFLGRDGEQQFHDIKLIPEHNKDGQIVSVLGIGRDVTQQARIQAALTASEEQFRSLAQNLPDNIARFDKEGRYLYVNPAYERFLGKSSVEIVGTLVDKEHYPEGARHMAEVLASGTPSPVFREEVVAGNGEIQLHEIIQIPERNARGELASVLVIGRDVTVQGRAEAALRASERKFRSLAEHLPDNIARWDTEGHYLYLNPVHARIIGKPADQLIGTGLDFERFPEMARAILDVAATGSGIPFTRQTLVVASGETRVHEISLLPERNEQGTVVSVLGIGRDVTEQVKAQEALAASEQQFRSLAEHSLDSVVRWDCNRRILYVNPAHERVLGKPADALVGTISDDNKYSEIARAIEQVATTGEARLFARQPVVNRDGETRIHEVSLIPERNAEGAIVSILGMGRDVTERVRMQEALATSERQFRSLAEHLPINVGRWDCNGYVLYANPVYLRTLQKTADQVIGTRLEAQYLDNVLQVAASGKAMHFPAFPMPGENDEWRIHEVELVPEWDDNGRVESVLGIGRDITEQVRMQMALVSSERQFRSLAENMPDNVARWDAEGRYLYINPTHERTLGKPASDVVGTFLPQSHDQVWAAFARIEETGEGVSCIRQSAEVPGVGMEIHEISVIPERNPDGKIATFLGIGRNMTEQVRMQEALMASEQQFRTLAENLPNNIIRYDTNGRILYANPAAERTLGSPVELLIGTEPHQRPQFRFHGEYEKRIARAAQGEPSQMEVFSRSADGREGWHLIDFNPEKNQNGEVTSVLAVSHDITARKNREIDLAMAASVFNAASEAIVITNPAGKILRVNPAFSSITGYPLHEVANRHPAMLEPGRRADTFYQSIGAALLAQGAWSGEVEGRRRDGDIFTARLSISAVHGNDGEVIHYVGIFSDISQFKRHEIQLQYIAHHDTLTGLPNRILLTDRLHQAIAQARRAGNILAVLFIDLDGFKPINDRFGHRAGDHTLVEMALRMASTLRAGDTVARIGGDEFIVLLPGLTSLAECEASTRRLLKAIAEPLDVDGCRFTLSASIGIALYPDDADDPDSLLRHADEAMYMAKRTGRSQYVLSSHNSQRGDSRLDGNLVHELRVALEQDQIEVHYQPIVDLATGRITKAEALVRWRHPERGLVPPVEFIPLAEDSGLIHAVGNQVFAQSVETAQRWNQRCPLGGLRRISVNRSPREFLDPAGIEDWAALLQRYGEQTGRMLAVEITEGLLLDDRPKVLEQLKQLRALGVTIALDDFGTGFSSLAYLKKFDIDYLKIDRSFVLDIVHDASDRVIVESIIAMARHLGIELIAEGVENEDQAGLLAGAHCHYAQGYLYARPMPAREFLDFVAAAEQAPLTVPAPRRAIA